MHKILILSNINNYESKEDYLIKKRLERDGNIVDIKWLDYDEKLDKYYDLIIRRNCWVEKKEDTDTYKNLNSKLINRLRNNHNVINLIGLDGLGKLYLKSLYRNNYNVVPTTDILTEALKWDCEEYVLKLKDSFGSGLGQLFVSKDKLKEKYNDKFLIQPKIKFQSEIQAYFVNDRLMYVYEYTPSKWPDYPIPKLIKLKNNEKMQAKQFARLSPIKVGMKRIDFLKLENSSLSLLEIEDNSPHMNIEILPDKLRNRVLDNFAEGIYDYINELNVNLKD